MPTTESAYRHRLDAAFRQDGVEPPVHVIESMSTLTNATLLQESDMLGVMPLNVARYYRKLGLLDPPPECSNLDLRRPAPGY